MNVGRQGLLPRHAHARSSIRSVDSCTRACLASTPTARVLVPAWPASSIDSAAEQEPLVISTPVQSSLVVSSEVRDIIEDMGSHDAPAEQQAWAGEGTDTTLGVQGHSPTAQPLQAPDESLIQQLSQDLGISRDRMQRIVRRWGPRLSTENLELVSMRLHSLSALLRCKPVEAAAAVSLEPRLIHLPAPALQQQVQSLSTSLQAPVPVILTLCRHNPSLVYEQPELVSSRAQQTAAVMHVSLHQFIDAACEESWLLKAPPDTISARLKALCALLQIEPGHKCILSHPRLLCMNSQDMSDKLQCLSRCLHMQPSTTQDLIRTYPMLLNFSTSHMECTISTLSQHIPLRKLQFMVFREPSLLCRAPGRLANRIQDLQHLLACPKDMAVDIIARRPCLLTCSPASLSSSYRALSVWRLSAEQKRQLIQAHPSLLRLTGGEVHGRCRWLRELMLRNAYFHAALRELPMNLLGCIILHLPLAWSRLQYLAESNHETGVDIAKVAEMKEAQFRKRHPGFERWLSYKAVELGACTAPWRVRQAEQQHDNRKRRPEPAQRQQQRQPQHRAGAPSAGKAPRSSSAVLSPLRPPAPPAQPEAQSGLPAAVATPAAAEPQEVTVVHEAKTVIVGGHIICKPRRVVNVRVPNTKDVASSDSTPAEQQQVDDTASQ